MDPELICSILGKINIIAIMHYDLIVGCKREAQNICDCVVLRTTVIRRKGFAKKTDYVKKIFKANFNF